MGDGLDRVVKMIIRLQKEWRMEEGGWRMEEGRGRRLSDETSPNSGIVHGVFAFGAFGREAWKARSGSGSGSGSGSEAAVATIRRHLDYHQPLTFIVSDRHKPSKWRRPHVSSLGLPSPESTP